MLNLAYWNQGVGAVPADQLNTYVQACINIAQLRGFIGKANMMVYIQGLSVPGDGGQGIFYWNPSATGADDGENTVQPIGSGPNGRWLRLSPNTTIPAGRTPVDNVNYIALLTDQWISYTNITAARTVIMPLSSDYAEGDILSIGDESGQCSLTNTITAVTQGSDKFGQTSTTFAMVSAYSYVDFRNTGTGLWIPHQ